MQMLSHRMCNNKKSTHTNTSGLKQNGGCCSCRCSRKPHFTHFIRKTQESTKQGRHWHERTDCGHRFGCNTRRNRKLCRLLRAPTNRRYDGSVGSQTVSTSRRMGSHFGACLFLQECWHTFTRQLAKGNVGSEALAMLENNLAKQKMTLKRPQKRNKKKDSFSTRPDIILPKKR